MAFKLVLKHDCPFVQTQNMTSESLYDVLGVEKTASEKDIKTAYKKLAMKLHPDKDQSVTDAERALNEETFKNVTAAYATLSDARKRQQYDLSQGGGGSDAFAGMFNVFDMFRSRSMGRPAVATVTVTLEEAYTGLTTSVPFTRRMVCSTCAGCGYADSADAVECGDCSGAGYTDQQFSVGGFMSQTVRTACSTCGATGKRIITKCRGCKGRLFCDKPASVRIKIPAGVFDQQSIVLRGRGHEVASGVSGDLVLTVRIKPHGVYRRLESNDLECRLAITLRDALVGYRTTLKFLDGTDIDIDTSQQIVDPSTCIELTGKGMMTSSKKRTRLLIRFDIKFPVSLGEFMRDMNRDHGDDDVKSQDG